MKIIKSTDIESALLKHIYDAGGSVKSSATYMPLGVAFGLSPEEMKQTLDEVQGHGGSASKWENMVRWARNSLAEQGYLLRPNPKSPRGTWELTETGKLAAQGAMPFTEAQPSATYPDEVPQTFPEGGRYSITVNSYERNPDAREKCLVHYGYTCSVCKFDFEKRYGSRGKHFIHVHHLTPISSIQNNYEIDPIKDLRPVCPNCHAMLHRTNPPCSVEYLISTLIHSST
ncbi:winged helix-turn-helix domain-containing protein [Burkholderia vietnamiensis]|uniref:winged helix-turn-helix domain-containing protein n=1 Tax=Burkholderia vietnamiensis TaxID=60552 RepID=UPI0009C03791|nr:winged helix-turn-helix domain-containing protein [Burkholderia vietnamiensis]MDN7928344.1 winged helix-turn-helix domain-containing protein [Burkholderia vietnamiensis]HDR9251444.1 HNH endonuclease [Burkholderia vietnamiensis]